MIEQAAVSSGTATPLASPRRQPCTYVLFIIIIIITNTDTGTPQLTESTVPIPIPAPNQLLVKVSHVARNPTDVSSLDRNAFGNGAVLGCDFVGEVIQLGSEVTRYKPGDVVAGLIWGASTVPLAAATAWLALFSRDRLCIPREDGDAKGEGTSVGLYTIQLAAMFGLEVVTTCSPKHAELVRSYGATHVFDYRDEGGRRILRMDVVPGTNVSDVLVWTAFLKDHAYGALRWPASRPDHELTSEVFEKIPAWLESGVIKPSHPKVLEGLDSVPSRFQEYRAGKVSAFKIVLV
ncbi:GroES-like protein [Aspergillus heteromorphus CBS 117.55]|uniref:GroES-like protein n=1 Tax=Aspergillus heteromorphus CBS 117.55 TaxID=1448321 RepID=A0A317X080_9EURO|nr:GroES-like protein [Aspergillus heteromorphus CBS 117.55]PWY90967.1 GroES-like protein [Aspergillus heteromorphus CBS 117.55]